MRLINKLTQKLQRHPKRIVFPDGMDHRVLQAARQYATKRLGAPILLGERQKIKETAFRLDISLDHIRLINPVRSEDLETFAQQYFESRKNRGVSEEAALETVSQPNYFASLMLANAQADGLVFGAGTPASKALPSLFRCIPLRNNVETASSVLILDLEDNQGLDIHGGLFLSDCAVLPDPDASQLADIAISTATLAHHLTGETPRVALLSYTTYSENSPDPTVTKMAQATKLAREKAKTLDIPILIDGEVQADVALDKYAAKQKDVSGDVAGHANVLIFPNLHSSNIAAKMVAILAGGYGYGQIMTGLTKPAAQVSRGASAHDIFATSVIVGAQATDRKLLLT
ncbi:MAG: phosphate acyltransferase [Verrucomicrobia bacterium]|nr:phosphate acyltransferase [Verrucomicrobiota bacterium]